MPNPNESRALAEQARLYLEMGPERRVAIAFELSELTRQLALAGLRARHPEYSEAELMGAFVASRWPGAGRDQG